MREVPVPVDLFEDGVADQWYNSGYIGLADNNQAYDVLEAMDKILKHYGLEVIIYDTGRDDYTFSIQRLPYNY